MRELYPPEAKLSYCINCSEKPIEENKKMMKFHHFEVGISNRRQIRSFEYWKCVECGEIQL